MPPGLSAREDIPYSRPAGRDLSLDIYRKPGRMVQPAVILVHGGGWLAGDRTMGCRFVWQLALRGYVAVPVSYRLGADGRFPASVYDLKWRRCAGCARTLASLPLTAHSSPQSAVPRGARW